MNFLSLKNFFIAKKPFSQKNGFTLLELLLSVGLMGLLAGIAAPMYLSLQAENEVIIAATTVGDVMRRGQIRAQSVDADSAWGVELSSSTMIIFKGNNYVARDQNFDESYNLAATINFSGLSEVIFNKFSGWPTASGTVVITHQDGRKKSVSISEIGVIGIQ